MGISTGLGRPNMGQYGLNVFNYYYPKNPVGSKRKTKNKKQKMIDLLNEAKQTNDVKLIKSKVALLEDLIV